MGTVLVIAQQDYHGQVLITYQAKLVWCYIPYVPLHESTMVFIAAGHGFSHWSAGYTQWSLLLLYIAAIARAL